MATVIELDAAKQKVAAAKANRVKASFDYYAADGEIYLFGEIAAEEDGGIDAGMVSRALKKIGNKPATVFIDSVGGAVDIGISIYNLFESHKAGVTTIISGLAASISSVIFQAGQRRIVYANSMLMVHSPHTSARGNAAEMRQMADLLDRYGQRLVDIYAQRTRKSPEQIRQMMDEETWLNGREIVAAGFADSVSTRVSGAVAAKRSSPGKLSASSRQLLLSMGLVVSAEGQVTRLSKAKFPQRERAIALLKLLKESTV